MNLAAQAAPIVPDDEERTKSMIRSMVLGTLKEPERGERVQVHRLWENRYRANVLVTDDSINVRISRSYFLVVDQTGKIVACTPAIVPA